MLNSLHAGVLAVGVLFVGTVRAAAQTAPQSDREAIEMAAAGYAPTHFRNRKLGFDPTPHSFYHGTEAPRLSRQDSALSAAAGARVFQAAEVRFCRPQPGLDCVDELFRIGAPAINGDSATVWLYAQHYWQPPGGTLAPGLYHTDDQLLVVRSGQGWKVVRVLQSRVE